MQTLRAELVLISLDERGRWPDPLELNKAIDAAALCELIVAERLGLDGDRIPVRDRSVSGDATLDAVLAKVAAKDKVRDLHHWLTWGLINVKTRVRTVDELVQSGVLEVKRWRLGHRYPETSGGLGSDVRNRVRATLVEGASADVQTLALVALALAAGLHKRLIADRKLSEVSALVDGVYERTEASEHHHSVVRTLSAAVTKEIRASRQTIVVTG